MTRRRKITLTALITAGIVVIASSAAAAALVLRDDPAAQQQPAAFTAPAGAAPQSSPAELPDPAGEDACRRLFTDGALDFDLLFAADFDAASAWVDDLHRIATNGRNARTDDVQDASRQIITNIQDGNGQPLNDLIETLTNADTGTIWPLIEACITEDMISQELVDRWADQLTEWSDSMGG